MVVGFNHNFRYKGEVYHIQTEDSGLKNPSIVTLLYFGGTILASKKTSYADITKVDNLEQVVEELMKEQHKNMLRGLKVGEYDDVIERFQSGRLARPTELAAAPVIAPPAAIKPSVAPIPATPVATLEPLVQPVVPVQVQPEPKQMQPPAAQPLSKSKSTVEVSLDEVILSYLMGDEK